MFTETQIKEIRLKLAEMGMKDSSLPSAKLPLVETEEISFVQNGKNVKMRLSDLVNNLLLYRATDFINISEKYNNQEFTLEEAVETIALKNKKPGVVVTFIDSITHDWSIYQYKGIDENGWDVLTNWDNILAKVDNHFKGFFATAEILQTNYEHPIIGDFAFVGDTLGNSLVYRCLTKWTWTATSEPADDYIGMYVSGSVTIGPNGNWFNNGVDTGFKASGPSGKTSYLHIRYSSVENPTDGQIKSTPDVYIGLYSNFDPIASTTATDYVWARFQGFQGVKGDKGDQGTAYYMWIKYADSSTGSGMSTSPENKSYIGIAQNKTSITASDIPEDYTWVYFKGPAGEKGDDADIRADYNYISLNTSTNTYTVNFSETRNAIIDLNSNIPEITYLNIINVPLNEKGRILIKQSGEKVLIPSSELIQEVKLPIQINKVSLLEYRNIDESIYLNSLPIISDIIYEGPPPILDFNINTFDGITLKAKWTEPYSEAPDNSPISGYDIRYSHTPIVDGHGWLNAVKIKVTPPIVGSGLENSVEIKLKPGNSYYLYIKSYKNYKNTYYSSVISNPINVTTKSYIDNVLGQPKMLPLTVASALAKMDKYEISGGREANTSFLFDKEYVPISQEDERPNTSAIIEGTTSWIPQKYWEDSLPYYAVFDLQDIATIDSIYMYTKDRIDVSVYATKFKQQDWTYIGPLQVPFNGWGFLSFNNLEVKDYRYIKLAWEKHRYADNADVPDGTPIWSQGVKEFEGALQTYQFFGVFGYPKTAKPLTILNPVRDYSTKYTLGDVVNVNGHFYQGGRIHSLVGGFCPRLFGNFTLFEAEDSVTPINRYSNVANFKVKTEQLNWVSMHGPNPTWTLRNLLQNTYKPYGLKPMLTSSGDLKAILRKTYVEDEFGNKTYTVNFDSKPNDLNYFSKDNPPSPVKGENGVDAILDITTNPEYHKLNTKLSYALAAKYGSTKLTPEQEAALPIETEGLPLETLTSGLDLISAIENGNEKNKTWKGWEGHQQAYEAAAWLSAIYDGNLGALKDENAVPLIGMKGVDPNILVVSPGLTGIDANYFYHQDFKAMQLRQDYSLPQDVYSVHLYSSSLGVDQTTYGVGQGVAFDMQPDVLKVLKRLNTYRNSYAPTKQLWLTEFGFGEAGGYGTESKYAAYTLPGYVQDGYTIPDVHRSEMKSAYTLRSILTCLEYGFSMAHYYSTECELNWFDESYWGQGAGFEMFEWDKLTDETPGAKALAIQSSMIQYSRPAFSSMGLFGQLLGNGAYPISRGTWMHMTFRNTLKDYYFTGMRVLPDYPKLKLACFAHKNENKSAFVVYRIGNTNSCYTNVLVPIPSETTKTERVDYHIPKIVDPRTVPYDYNFGVDAARTGLPTSQRVYDNNGKVVSATFPTLVENPFFPIVGPVAAKGIFSKKSDQPELSYNFIQANEIVNEDKTVTVDNTLAWRQVDAICDYIEFHPEGILGSHGIFTEKFPIQDKIKIDIVTEIPIIYLLEGSIIQPSYYSQISDLIGVAQNSNSIKLFWNNNNPKDEFYDLYISTYPDGGYVLTHSIPAGAANEYNVLGLNPATSYYFKIQPRFGNQVGDMSDYAAMRTYDFVETPTNFTAEAVSLTSIKVQFDSVYTEATTNVFLNYTIERRSQDGIVKTALVTNKSQTIYFDNNLNVGTNYSYRVKVTTYNGNSAWTDYINTRTLTPEEANPAFVEGEADKIINVIKVLFDVDLSSNLTIDMKNYFVLKEGDNNRVIMNIGLDTHNPKLLILTYYPESLSTFDKNIPVTLSYTQPVEPELQIKSIYGNPMQSFVNKLIKNNFGNYENLIHSYLINITNTDENNFSNGWNNITPVYMEPEVFTNLKDKYDYQSNIRFSILQGSEIINGIKYNWVLEKNVSNIGTYDSELYPIPQNVYETLANVAFHATNAKLHYSYMKLSNLNDNNRYTLNIYCSRDVWNANTAYLSININGIDSGLFNYANNTNKFITFTDVRPINGQIHIKLFSEGLNVGSVAPINFIMLDEFEDGSQPDTDTVFIREIYILNQIN